MTSYAEKAVAAVKAHYSTALQAQLTIVETEDSLSAGALVAPVGYLDYPAAGDNRSPLLQVFEEGLGVDDQRNGLWNVPVEVVLTYQDAAADPSTSYATMRRYLTALLYAVLKNPTLSGAVIGCSFRGADALQEVGGKSAGRHHYVLDWDVAVHTAV